MTHRSFRSARRSRTPLRQLAAPTLALALAVALLPSVGASADDHLGSIAGAVVDGGGLPLEGIHVALWDHGLDEQIGDITTDSNGEYEFTTNVGDYRLRFSDPAGTYVAQWFDGAASSASAQIVTVSSGQTTQLTDIVLVEGGKILVEVTNAETEPVAGISVTVYDEDLEFVGGGGTDGGGEIEVGGVPAGLMYVHFSDDAPDPTYAPVWYGNTATAALATPVAVAVAETTNISITMPLVSSISGTVLGEVAGDSPAPIEGVVRVGISDTLGNQVLVLGEVEPDGTYTIEPLPPGDYTLNFFTVPHENHVPQWYDDNFLFEDADTVTIVSGGCESVCDCGCDLGVCVR